MHLRINEAQAAITITAALPPDRWLAKKTRDEDAYARWTRLDQGDRRGHRRLGPHGGFHGCNVKGRHFAVAESAGSRFCGNRFRATSPATRRLAVPHHLGHCLLVAYVVLFRDALTLMRALVLGIALWLFVLVFFFPVVGWGFFGLAVGPKMIVGAAIPHLLFAFLLWGLCRWAFRGTPRQAIA